MNLTRRKMTGFTVLIISSENYIKYARVLIYSILRNCEGQPVRWIIYSNGNGNRVEPMFRNVEVEQIILPVPQHKNPSELRNYFANCRPMHLQQMVAEGKGALYLDADSIVRSDKLTELCEQDTISAHGRQTEIIENKFLLSTIYFPATSLDFLEKWSIRIQPRLFGPWYSDQVTFFEQTLNSSKTIIRQLPDTYIDINHERNSIVWCGKGGHKFGLDFRQRYSREFFIYDMCLRVETAFRRYLVVPIRLNPQKIALRFHQTMHPIILTLRRLKNALRLRRNI